MTRQRYAVTATRGDGSTITAADLHHTEAAALVAAVLDAVLDVALTIRVQRSGVEYADNGPIGPLDEVIAWRQPADVLTQLFRGNGGAQ